MSKTYLVARTSYRVQKRPGNILPLAVIMMLIILMAGIGIGVVVLEGAQRAQQADQAVAAYYMADSGVERQLYEIRKNNQTRSFVATLGGVYFNGGTWQSSSGLEQPTSKSFTTVATSSFAVLDLFDPDNLIAPLGIDNMHLTWTSDPACGGTPSRIEVSYAYWDVVMGVPQFPSDNQFRVANKISCCSLDEPLDSNKRYRIRLKAYDCPAKNVLATFTGGGVAKTYPGDITLSAEGTYGKATQKIAVTMPKLDILSGVFGYVIFSECTLVKGAGGVVCP
ncbi:hypothetical protein HZC53_05910 [Candidatus Uhrbacteria bacterium]|nr:hypothetical protein [Candidatus Uhrbacteria bacterium]